MLISWPFTLHQTATVRVAAEFPMACSSLLLCLNVREISGTKCQNSHHSFEQLEAVRASDVACVVLAKVLLCIMDHVVQVQGSTFRDRDYHTKIHGLFVFSSRLDNNAGCRLTLCVFVNKSNQQLGPQNVGNWAPQLVLNDV